MNAQFMADILVSSQPGMDASAAARFVRTASRFDADIAVHYHGATANAKSIIGLLSLCVREGETIRVVASGADAMAAVEALEKLFAAPPEGIGTPPPREPRVGGGPRPPSSPRPAAV